MSATVTFTAEHNGQTYTRTSGTMPYVAITVGSQVQWHKSFAAAHKAATSRTQTYATGVPAEVVPVAPTAIQGKLGDWHPEVDGWGDIPAAAFAALVAAKAAPAPAAKAVKVNSRGETPAQARARQRADKKAREAAEQAAPVAVAKNLTFLVQPYPVEQLREEAEDAAIQAEMDAQAAKRAKVAPAPEMVLVRVEGKPQARLDTISGKLVWRNSTKGRAARAAGLWT